MAMNGDILGTSIANLIINEDTTPEGAEQVTNLWKQIASAIISHIQTNASVSVTVQPGISVTVVPTTGTGATVGTGTGSGTIS